MGNIFSGYIKLTAPLKESVGKSVGVDKKTTDTSNDFLTGIADSIFGGDNSLNSPENIADRARQLAWNKEQSRLASLVGNQVGTAGGRDSSLKVVSAPILYTNDKGYHYSESDTFKDWVNSGPALQEETIEDTITGDNTPIKTDSTTTTTVNTTTTNKTKMAASNTNFLSSINPLYLVGGVIAIAAAVYYFIIKK